MLADLHIHTVYSDGIYTPEQILDMAEHVGIKALAITDHDNTNAHARTRKYLAEKGYDIKFIPGVEIDTFFGSRDYNVHVLGFYFNADNQLLQEKLAWTGAGRVRRISNIIKKIQDRGYDLTVEDVKKEAKLSMSIGRPHIARVMVRKGYFPSINEVFDTLIGEGKPCYCKQEKLTPQEAVEVIHQAGGIASFAHPSEVGSKKAVDAILAHAKFDAIEVWHPSAQKTHETGLWLKKAKELQLMTSGGSDFHGDPRRYPSELGIFEVKYADVADIINYK